MSEVVLIWAQDLDGAIGVAGGMPWHLPEDLAHFKRVTMGHSVVMGRRTWESLPASARPLPGRVNYVLTRDETFRDHGAIPVRSLEEALEATAGTTTFVIGGGQVFAEAMKYANRLIVTHVEMWVSSADVFAPKIRRGEWKRVSGDPDEVYESVAGWRYNIFTYTRYEAREPEQAPKPEREYDPVGVLVTGQDGQLRLVELPADGEASQAIFDLLEDEGLLP